MAGQQTQGPRLIALDLDGTLLDPGGQIRPATRAAVAAAIGRGVEVVLVTGRHHTAVHPFHHELGLASPAICCNGTYLYDFGAGEVLAGNPLERGEARAMLELCRGHGMHCLVYADDVMTYETVSPQIARFRRWAETLPVELRPGLREVADFGEVIGQARRVWKFVVSHDDGAALGRWIAAARAGGAFNVEVSWHHRVDVSRAGPNKGERLLEWAAGRGIAPAEILAFGDNHNDLSMLTAVGQGVAMGNAEPEVRAAAARVVGGNDTDAIGQAIMAAIGA